APTTGITGNSGDALFPVIGGTNVPGMDILSSSIGLSGKTLTLTTRVVDLSNSAATAAKITGTAFLQYVTRWQMGNTIYYGAMENTELNRPTFYAGAAQSVALCSVSACFPYVITYPQPRQPTLCRQVNGNWHVPGKNSGEASFNLHQDDCDLQPPSVAFNDPNSGVNFQSTQMTSVTYDDVAHTVTIVGTGTDNGL